MEEVIRLSFDNIECVVRSEDEGTKLCWCDDGKVVVHGESIEKELVKGHRPLPSNKLVGGVKQPSTESNRVRH